MGLTTVVDDGRAAIARRLPHIDYASHPAYGRMFEWDKWVSRRTVSKLQPFFEDAKRSERERAAQFGYRYGSGTDLTRELSAGGFSVRQLEPALLEPLQRAVQPLIVEIRERLEDSKAAGAPVAFKATQEMIGPDRHADIWRLAAKTMRAAGVVQASQDYFGAPAAKLKACAVMVNQPDQAWCTDIFRGEPFETPPTVGFHIDSSGYCTLKVVLYLNDVGPDQGPFGLVPTSHLWEQGRPERTRRRAFDRSPLVSRAPGERLLFASLPADMQLKAEFGGDMLAGAPETLRLLAEERVMTGPRGQMNLFDPEAIHRGGHTARGERVVMLLSVAARFGGQAEDAA